MIYHAFCRDASSSSVCLCSYVYWLNVFSNTTGDFIPARATSMTSLCLCSSHRDITEACVSSGSTIPSLTSSILLFPVLISLRSEWDHFSSVQWPKEHHRQGGALCMRHPCDGVIWAAARQGLLGHSRLPTALALPTEAESLLLLQASHWFMKYKLSIPHQFLSRQRKG